MKYYGALLQKFMLNRKHESDDCIGGKRANQSRLRDLTQTLLILGCPIGISFDIMFEILRGWPLSFPQHFFAFWLCVYFLCILLWEYCYFPELHDLKWPPTDVLLLVGVFLSVRQFNQAVENVPASMSWMCLGLVSVIIWESYTMFVGRKKYFNAPVGSLWPFPMARHFLNCLRFKSKNQPRTHWDEYRYWLMLDLVLLVPTSGSIVLCERIRSADVNRQILWSFLALCFGLTIFNIQRYRLMRADVVKARKSSD